MYTSAVTRPESRENGNTSLQTLGAITGFIATVAFLLLVYVSLFARTHVGFLDSFVNAAANLDSGHNPRPVLMALTLICSTIAVVTSTAHWTATTPGTPKFRSAANGTIYLACLLTAASFWAPTIYLDSWFK